VLMEAPEALGRSSQPPYDCPPAPDPPTPLSWSSCSWRLWKHWANIYRNRPATGLLSTYPSRTLFLVQVT